MKNIEAGHRAPAPDVRADRANVPPWITPELIERTIEVWQPYYETPLSADDAVKMILGVARLYHALAGDAGHETVRRAGTGKQSGTGT